MQFLGRLNDWIRQRPIRGDIAAVIVLTLLWVLFFWRVLTPRLTDQVSLPQGDFSGQFVSFGDYQARRLLAGQVPLWNPYNYAGAPFLADTQSAVFYLPRLATILISSAFGGWGYQALQAEVLAHYWLASLFMFLFVRTLTSSRLAGITSAVAFTYSGFLTGYPPLQVAVLEASIWLPLCLLGILKASNNLRTGSQWAWSWLALSAVALGLSLMAGHPQTSLFLTYGIIIYMIERAAHHKIGWKQTLVAVAAVCAAGYGLAAIQLIPGLEYTALTTRTNLTFDLRSTGFPFSDLITILIPNVFTVWSPLYVGFPVLILALVAFQASMPSARFWGFFTLTVIILSFGSATIVYQLGYLVTPGLTLFRDQERAVYLAVFAAAVLAGLGVAALQSGKVNIARTISALRWWLAIAGLLAFNTLIAKLMFPHPPIELLSQASFFAVIVLVLCLVILKRLGGGRHSTAWLAGLVALVVFDLFSTTIRGNWEPVPASSRKFLSDLVPVAEADTSLYRVDGRLGLGENYGTLIGMQDINGTSPLRLRSLDAYRTLPDYRAYQLLAVKYVFTDWTQLEIPSTIRGETEIAGTKAMLHEITQPMPRAWMAYRVVTSTDPDQALGLLADPAFDPAATVILSLAPSLSMPETPPDSWSASVTTYLPEHIELTIETPENGILVISEMDYPGWQATVDGAPQPILNADAGLRALALTPGQHTITLDYRPLSFQVGLIFSVISALGLIIVLGISQLAKRDTGEST